LQPRSARASSGPALLTSHKVGGRIAAVAIALGCVHDRHPRCDMTRLLDAANRKTDSGRPGGLAHPDVVLAHSLSDPWYRLPEASMQVGGGADAARGRAWKSCGVCQSPA
jgi:hypothetical protein